MSTPYHAKYIAHELTKLGGKGIDRLSMSLFNASVDLNPHQIEAAAFALRSPLSKGVLLADEVGLGKTIEAGLVLCQYWAEKKRRLLVICPASLRKQWALELEEKFNLPSLILDAKSFRELQASGKPNPFENDSIVITSVNFASRYAEHVRTTSWDLIVIDEAHKLRNAYRTSNKMGQNIRWATENKKKILLTATPLQNSLLELYGLASILDENTFGDVDSFRTQYMTAGADLDGLRLRLYSFCKRTLRQQVLEYVKYTQRRLLTRPFLPTEKEQRLYDSVSNFLKRDDTYALPSRQRHLTVMIARKLLASSSIAVAGTLEAMKQRLIRLRDNIPVTDSLAEELIANEDIEDDFLDDILSNEEESNKVENEANDNKIDLDKLSKEIQELDKYIEWANSIGIDTKCHSLLKALEIGFQELSRMGASPKAVIFTESRRTQAYLKDYLKDNGYQGKILTFNGTNSDPDSKEIYDTWVKVNQPLGRITGTKNIDCRTAIIEHFRDNAEIMIATEAAAEGINLQFCSLIINYDLPWNPQRIEQRIGRCHRYGQKHDVVVINFLNERNEADKRVHELLEQKFHLFNGVFGASDEVLGAIESGVDFEKRVLSIYQECRTAEEIETAFKVLQAEMEESIESKLAQTRQTLLERFDEDVHDRLKTNLIGAKDRLDRISKLFWSLSQFMLNDYAAFDNDNFTFHLTEVPAKDISVNKGIYHLISKTGQNVDGEFLYRLSHPLGEHVLATGKDTASPTAHVKFDITNHPAKISIVESLKGNSGWLTLQKLTIDSFEKEEHLLFSAFDKDGNALDQETCEKLFLCSGETVAKQTVPLEIDAKLKKEADRHVQATISASLETNNEHFVEERDRLDQWAEDMILSLEKELASTKAQIKALRRQARLATSTQEQHDIQTKTRDLEKKMRKQRQTIFDAEDAINNKRDRLIDSLEKRMVQKTSQERLFAIQWSVA